MDALWQAEIAITLFLQSLGAWLIAPLKAITNLGSEEFFLLVVPAIYWCVDLGLGLRIGIMLSATNVVNSFFKTLFHGSRPYWFDTRVRGLSSETSFGIPSGHSQHAASVWGLLAAKVKARWLTILVVVMVFLIGFSRIFLGMHFTTDVLSGWLLGVLLIVAFILLEPPVLRWIKRLSLPAVLGVCFVGALLVMGLTLLPIELFGDWEIPVEWKNNALATHPDVEIDPFKRDGAFTMAGTFLGMTAGAAWLVRNGGYDAGGTFVQRLLRFLIGASVTVALWYGLGKVFPRNADLTSYLLRFLRYIIISGWVSLAAPLLFIRMKLASKQKTG